MIKFIPFYPHIFRNDPRVQQLEPREQQQFLFLLYNMMLTQAKMAENYKSIAHMLGITTPAAKALVNKLKLSGLLISSATGEKLLTLTNTRLTKEYNKAKAKCDGAKQLAKSRADKRWQTDNKTD